MATLRMSARCTAGLGACGLAPRAQQKRLRGGLKPARGEGEEAAEAAPAEEEAPAAEEAAAEEAEAAPEAAPTSSPLPPTPAPAAASYALKPVTALVATSSPTAVATYGTDVMPPLKDLLATRYPKWLMATDDPMTAFYGPTREIYPDKWFPNGKAEHLDGTLAGDFGVDPFRLGVDPENLAKFREKEIINGRWAMLAVTGIAAPEFSASLFDDPADAVWTSAGAKILSGPIDYLGNADYIHASNIWLLAGIQFAVMSGVETYRMEGGIGYPKETDPVKRCYPGGKFFDPLGLADDPVSFADLQVKELKNGRLAMLAFLGCLGQAAYTDAGPVQNAADHVADPSVNVWSNIAALYDIKGIWSDYLGPGPW